MTFRLKFWTTFQQLCYFDWDFPLNCNLWKIVYTDLRYLSRISRNSDKILWKSKSWWTLTYSRKNQEHFAKPPEILPIFCKRVKRLQNYATFEFGAVPKCAKLDTMSCYKMNYWLKKSTSIQPRTGSAKFVVWLGIASPGMETGLIFCSWLLCYGWYR